MDKNKTTEKKIPLQTSTTTTTTTDRGLKYIFSNFELFEQSKKKTERKFLLISCENSTSTFIIKQSISVAVFRCTTSFPFGYIRIL